MKTITELFPQTNDESARITMTNEFTIINGSHMQISNGFLHKKENPSSVITKDILSIERQKLRKKRLLVISLTLFGFCLILNTIFGQAGRILAFEDMLRVADAYQDATRGANLSPFAMVRYTTVGVLLIGAILCISKYIIQQIRVLRITAMGGDYAVETKYYNDEDIDMFVKSYYSSKKS